MEMILGGHGKFLDKNCGNLGRVSGQIAVQK